MGTPETRQQRINRYFDESSVKQEITVNYALSRIAEFFKIHKTELNELQVAYLRSVLSTTFTEGINFQLKFDSDNP